jgi:type II secretory pathway component PulF
MRFRSTILEADGSTSLAVLDADSEQALHDQLHQNGRQLLRVKSLAVAEDRAATTAALRPRRLLLLTQALYEALDAGVPLLSTLAAVAEQEDDPAVTALLRDLGSRIAAGQVLSDAMASHPRAFPPLYVALVQAGEHSGSLPDVLQSIARFLEWRMEIASTVRQAMVYPAIVALAGYGMVLFLLAFVLPRLGDVLSKMGGELPAPSRMLIAASGFVAAHVVAVLVGSAAAIAMLVFAFKSEACRRTFAALGRRLPVVRTLLSTLSIAQFCRTFSVLLQAGLTMTAALELGGAAVADPGMRDRLDGCRRRILGGSRLGEALDEQKVLPPVALSMVMVGEEAGRLPITFERLSRLYDREVKAAVKRALGLLEPAVTVLLGIVVGGAAVLVVSTIYTAMKGVGR